ncbi:glutamate synthase subunit alpha, partial [Chelativorans composti]
MTEQRTAARIVPASSLQAAVSKRTSTTQGLPDVKGLYDPDYERDACGVGFIVQMKNVRSHQLVEDGLAMLENLTHRGAVGADPLVGDGAGIMIQIPDRLFREEMAKQGVELPGPGQYAVAHFFMPQDAGEREFVHQIIHEASQSEGFTVLGIRDVPVDNSSLSRAPHIVASEPYHQQVFFNRPEGYTDEQYERRLYILRKVISGRLYAHHGNRDVGAYCVSMSSRTIVYKGMFLAYQVGAYYKDLRDPRTESALALVHQRFSTNTFPSWK